MLCQAKLSAAVRPQNWPFCICLMNLPLCVIPCRHKCMQVAGSLGLHRSASRPSAELICQFLQVLAEGSGWTEVLSSAFQALGCHLLDASLLPHTALQEVRLRA